MTGARLRNWIAVAPRGLADRLFNPRKDRRVRTLIGAVPRGKDAYQFVSVDVTSHGVKAINDSALLHVGDESAQNRLRELGVHPGVPVVLALSRRESLVKTILAPSTDDAQIAEMMAYEVLAHTPWPPDEGLVAYQTAGADENGYSRVLLFMARKSVVEDHLTALSQWGVHPVRIEVSVSSAVRLLRETEDQERPALMIADEEGATYIRLIHGRYSFSRGASADETPVEMLRRSLETDGRQNGELGLPTSITIAGNQPLEPLSLASQVPRGTTVRPVEDSPMGLMNGAGNLHSETAMCVAAALGALEDRASANLLPEREIRTLVRREVFHDLKLAALLVLWFAGLVVATVHFGLESQRSRLATARQSIAALNVDAGNLKAENEALKRLMGERQAVSVPVRVVLELYKLTPATIALTSLHFDTRGSLLLGGEAPEFSELYKFLNTLSGSPLFRDVELKSSAKPSQSTGTDGIVEFKISCTVIFKESKRNPR